MRRSLLLAALVLAPASVHAQAPQPTPPVESTVHRHLGGFWRLDGGIGYVASSASLAGTTRSMSGVAIPFGFAFGGAVTENLIIAVDLWGIVAVTPKFTFGGQSATASNSSFGLGGFGLNLTYYFMPHNVYLSVTPSLVGLTLTGAGTSSSPQTGFGAKVGLGKEWWVGDHWGIGIAAQFSLGINADTGANPPTWTTLGGGLAFSATYN
jgi:hypothetical protein